MLGWKPEVSFESLVRMMVDADIASLEQQLLALSKDPPGRRQAALIPTAAYAGTRFPTMATAAPARLGRAAGDRGAGPLPNA